MVLLAIGTPLGLLSISGLSAGLAGSPWVRGTAEGRTMKVVNTNSKGMLTPARSVFC